jgi:hypothetical protein
MKETNFQKFKRWTTLSLLNFVIISLAGVLLRYKIAFRLPLINYEYLLNAHSHFAFAGWISTALFTAFVYVLTENRATIKKSYLYLFNLSQIANFGMLFSFLLEGYGTVSISFSILSIIFSYWFAWQYWKDLTKSNLALLVKYFARGALTFYVISSIGPLLLGYIIANKIFDKTLYHNSVYLFLHFQYNGWFTFGILTIFFQILYSKKILFNEKKGFLVFKLLGTACLPAYCLSILWTNPPVWIYILAALAGFVQLAGAVLLLEMIYGIRKRLTAELENLAKTFMLLSLAAFCIKFLLQALSAIPLLSHYASGTRPVIIGYLHLVLLGFISFFLFGFFLKEKLFRPVTGFWKISLIIFIIGVLANELFLMIQGLSSIMQSGWGSSGIFLLGVSVLIFLGLSLFLVQQIYYEKPMGDKLPVD